MNLMNSIALNKRIGYTIFSNFWDEKGESDLF